MRLSLYEVPLRVLVVLVTVLAVTSANAQLYVAPDAEPDGDGSAARPFASITEAATRARPGDTILLRRGVYYQAIFPSVSGTAEAPIAFQPAPGAEGLVVISGATPIPDGWTKEGDTWIWRWTESGLAERGIPWPSMGYPPFNTDENGNPLANPIAEAHVMNRLLLVAQSGEPVSGALADEGPAGVALWDGHPLLPVATRADVSASMADPGMQRFGSYFAEFDPVTGEPTLYVQFHRAMNDRPLTDIRPMLGVRPSGFQPDVDAGAEFLFQRCGSPDSPGHFLVRDLIFRHTNNYPTQGSICPGSAGSRFEYVTTEFHPAIGFQMGADRTNAGSGHFVEHSVAQYNGQIGFEGVCNDCYFIDNTVRYNNARGYDIGWEAGGMKLVFSSRNLVRRLRAEGNRGPGLWFDTDAFDNVVEGSYFLGNWFAGVFLELNAQHNLVQHNVVALTVRPSVFATDASGSGLLLQAVSNNTLVWNTIVNNEGNGLYIRDLAEVDGQVHNSRVDNNLILGNATLSNRPDLGFIGGEGYEIQLESRRLAVVRTNTLRGNHVLSHEGDPADASHAAFAIAALDQDWIFGTTNDLDQWRSTMGTDASDANALLPWDDAAYDDLWQPDAWGRYTFDADPRTALDAPPCARADCLPSCYAYAGANPDAVRTTLFDADDADEACARLTDTDAPPRPTTAFMLGAPYPNPSAGLVRVDLALPARADARLDVLDVLGRVVRTLAAVAEPSVAVDLRGLPPGFYALRLEDARTGAVRTTPVVVIR
ncbi:MAG: right-handed parallel beta-helix repeat-containing protein [Bacteroidota bacterium]